MEHAASATATPIRFETHPSRYVHWRLEIEPPLARLVMDVQEERALRGDYPLKLNSYDLGVDLELAAAIQRAPFDAPGAQGLGRRKGAGRGGGHELALACDEIVLVDDASSAVSLPEVPLLGVLPGTGGLTRGTDQRKGRPHPAA